MIDRNLGHPIMPWVTCVTDEYGRFLTMPALCQNALRMGILNNYCHGATAKGTLLVQVKVEVIYSESFGTALVAYKHCILTIGHDIEYIPYIPEPPCLHTQGPCSVLRVAMAPQVCPHREMGCMALQIDNSCHLEEKLTNLNMLQNYEQ